MADGACASRAPCRLKGGLQGEHRALLRSRAMVVVVTGATGFLGGAVVQRLVRDGHVVCATGRREGALAAFAGERGVLTVRAELEADGAAEALLRTAQAAGRVSAVVHCAALSAPWGPRRAFEAANVRATELLLLAALSARVARFVHVSTPALYFDGRDRHDVREDAPLPRPLGHYARTKLAAEHAVDRAVADGLAAVILRPRALFGPGDTTIFPRLLRALQAGRLPIIGSGTNRVDLTYIDNAADAVASALDAPRVAAGQRYNVTNGEPIQLWPLLRRVAAALGLDPPRRRIGRRTARAAAGLLELFHAALRLRQEPLLTRYTVGLLAADTTLDISAARRDLGYAPAVGVDEGIERFIAWWRDQPR